MILKIKKHTLNIQNAKMYVDKKIKGIVAEYQGGYKEIIYVNDDISFLDYVLNNITSEFEAGNNVNYVRVDTDALYEKYEKQYGGTV